MVNKNIYIEKILSSGLPAEIDCAVMFSSGKDSTYLLYLFKYIYNKNVIAVSVDNGFEGEQTWRNAESITKKMGIPFIRITEYREYFKCFYESAIKENEVFAELKEKGINYLCVTCNHMLWGAVAKYAFENNIPFVIWGLDPAQINREKSIDALSNLIQIKKYRSYNSLCRKLIAKTSIFENNAGYRNFINTLLKLPPEVTTILPFLYLEYNIDQIKKLIIEKIGWEPPTIVEKENYLSSGCKIVSMLYKIEALDIIRPAEREQIKFLVEDGAVDKRFLPGPGGISKEAFIDLSDEIYNILNIKDYLVEKCKERNIISNARELQKHLQKGSSGEEML